ncbi:Sdd3p NDAI_0G04280 [Naumovozyma dairenensis CBS 421]|uniref:Mitochondrial presequence protease n=1 Tax=Naumovozyma dairenensis (strain ATCC 10597 / BCRC 20456 / CBS 421 / NBRC 0211 / NRRL Y-12639) TaxID=1071378 RepID=J7SAZ0_NAUDC|nr:hypothetical protein NDAI_0G04280 [Naumovozyma dairenensis CBS 421]CCK73413.1 hypothetical protein NDAI_0G04280 [Naumovozyma dairenensis CBS 421]
MAFNKLLSFQLEYAPQYHLTKYVSARTGLQLVHIDHKSSPLVQGYFAVGTECPNDSGVPHTLEHLIFMGSKEHPYKGLLDTVGNLCMSSTNAWTATDQTVYTLTSAGWKGFSKLLPSYLNHILFPTLTDEACTTEVYHVDPEDFSDKGVVFSEMEAIESQSWFVTMLEKQRLMFPEGSGYRSETGGLTNNLRTLTNDEIKKFHKEMYSSDNLCLIICGNVPQSELLDIMENWDSTLPEKDNSTKKRPFLDTPESQIPSSRNEIIESTVEFPELDESQSEILFSWIGEPYLSYTTDLAVSMLLDYFTESALAPFTKQLVEISDPLANSTDYWTDDYMRTIINLGIHGVPTEKMEQTKAKVMEILATHEIDMARIKQVVDNGKWEYILRCEKNGDSVLSQAVITDFLYGDLHGSSLEASVKSLSDFNELSKWTSEQWSSLIKKIFIDNKPIIVLGKPSSELYESIDKEKEKLLRERKEQYGEHGLSKLRETLDQAQTHNNTPIPESLLEAFILENPEKTVDFISTVSITVCDDTKHKNEADPLTRSILNSKPENFPLFLHLGHFPSQFIELHCLLNSTCIKDTTLLPYYHVFTELFSMPMKGENNEIVIPYEEVVSKLKSETVDSQISLGLNATCPELIDLRIRCKSDDYSKAVNWIKHCLFDMIFDEKRVSVLVENYLNSIVELKREGDVMLESLTCRNIYSTRSMKKSVDPLYVESILEDVLNDIEDGKFQEKVLPRLETMRIQLREHFNKFHILIFGDVSKIQSEVYKPWESLIANLDAAPQSYKVKTPPVPRLLSSVSPLCKKPSERAYIITAPASESSYMNVITPVPFNLNYNDPEYAAVLLASEYLQCVEGPFWKGIRGSGLAYGANMVKMTEINSWGFNIYRGTDIVKCYQAGKQIVEGYATGVAQFQPNLMQGAVNSIINRLATIENGYFAASISKYVDDFLLARGPNFNKMILERLADVSIKELQHVMQKYFVNLFDSDKSVVFICCHPSKVEAVQEFLEEQGFTVDIEELEDEEQDEDEDDEGNSD